jgi:GNAT superfamily N-acetyltransferase
MDSDPSVRLRRRKPSDTDGAFRVFRRSLFRYLHEIGGVDAVTADNPPVEASWTRRKGWMEHLAATAAQDWVAEDARGQIVGWAQSVERDGDLELTFFFVDPTVQLKGVGRRLLERAFPAGGAHSRCIIATQAPRALGLYLRSGVHFVTTAAQLKGQLRPAKVASDLAIELIDPDAPAARQAIADLERELLGHARTVDAPFLLSDRPAWLARRSGQVQGMAFGVSRQADKTSGETAADTPTGPIGALDPGDLPALMATVENDALQRGFEELSFTIPMVNESALGYALERRYRIDPFYMCILSSTNRMRLDRWVQTQPEYII